MQEKIKKYQRGFSLVELLVGMVLGLFLLLSLAQMFLSTRASSRSDENIARMQEAGRVGIELMSRELRKAGYISDPIAQRDIVFPVSAPFQAIAAVSATASTIDLRYQGVGDAFTQTCTGGTVLPATLARLTFDVATSAGTSELRCASRIITGGVAGTVTTQPFVPNVEALNVLAGEDTTGDLQPDRYVGPSAVTDWTAVTSLSIQLRVVSADDNVVDAPQPYRDFTGALVTPTDRRLRRVYGTVLSLRNLVP